MKKEDIRLDIVKAALSGGLRLSTKELSEYSEWVSESVSPTGTVKEISKERRENDIMVEVKTDLDDVKGMHIKNGEFIRRMEELSSGRVVTKCMLVFDQLNVKTVNDLLNVSKRSVMHVKNTGKQTVEAIEKTLKSYGIEW